MNPGEKYDAVIEVSGTETGLILNRQRGQSIFRESFLRPLADQFFTSEPSYAASRPEVTSVKTQSDWRRGMGEQYFDDSYRYRSTAGCDARFKNRVLLSAQLQGNTEALMTEATGATHEAVTCPNAGWETWTNATTPANWTALASVTLNREATVVQAGTYSCRITTSGTAGDGAEVFLTQTPALQNVALTVTAYFRSNGTPAVRLQLMDEDGTSLAITNATLVADTWTQLSVAYTVDASSNESERIKVRLIHNDTLVDTTYFDAVAVSHNAVSAPTFGTFTDHEEFKANDYVSDQNGIWKWVDGDGKYDHVAGSPRYVVDMGVLGDDLFIACKSGGTTREYWWYDGTDFFKATAADPHDKANLFMAVGATLWKAWGTNSLASSTTPKTSSNWGATVSVGTSTYNINSMTDRGGLLYVGKENGLFTVTAAGVVTEVSVALRSLFDSNSGKNMLSWNGRVYTPMGKQALYEYDPVSEVLDDKGPADFSPGMEDYSGQALAAASDEAYLYAFVKGASGKIELLAGRYETVAGTTAWAWHPLYQLTASALLKCWISTTVANKKRLWWQDTETSVDYLRWMMLPDKYADVELATNYTFATSGTFETGFVDFGFRDQDKAFTALVIESENLTANVTITVKYKIDDDASWTALSTAYTTSPLQTKYFSTASIVKGKKIRFQFTFATNSSTVTPIMVSFAVYATVSWVRRREFTLPVLVMDNLQLRDSSTEQLTGRAIEGRLRQAAAQEYLTLKLPVVASGGTDMVSTSYFVRFDDMEAVWMETSQVHYGIKQFNIRAVELLFA